MALLRDALARFTIPASQLGIPDDEFVDMAVAVGDASVFGQAVKQLAHLSVALRTDKAARRLCDEWGLQAEFDVFVVRLPARYFQEVTRQLGRCLEVRQVHWLDFGWDRDQ